MVIRAMRKGNLLHKSRRNPNGLTKADGKKPDFLKRGDSSADSSNKKWLTDITLISMQRWKAVYCADDGLLCR